MSPEGLRYPIILLDQEPKGFFDIIDSKRELQSTNPLNLRRNAYADLIVVDMAARCSKITSVRRVAKGRLRHCVDTLLNAPVNIDVQLSTDYYEFSLYDLINRIRLAFKDVTFAGVYESAGLTPERLDRALSAARSVGEIIEYLALDDREEYPSQDEAEH